MNGNVGFELPIGKPRRNSRQNVIARDEGIDVSGAVSLMEEAERGAVALTNEVRNFAEAARQLLGGGLTERAIALLVQDLIPSDRHSHKKMPVEQILAVLHGAAKLGEYLKPAAAKR